VPKFNFNLAPILSIKEKMEDLRKNEFGKAVRELEDERQRLVVLEQNRTDCIQSFCDGLRKGVRPEYIGRHNYFLERLKMLIKQQKAVIKQAEAKVEEKREELVEAMRDRKTLDTLKENAFVEYITEEKRAEQKVVDEIVSYKVATNKTELITDVEY